MGDVRGKGLMIGIELVADKVTNSSSLVSFGNRRRILEETRRPLELAKMGPILEAIKDGGILVGVGGLHKNVRAIVLQCRKKGGRAV